MRSTARAATTIVVAVGLLTVNAAAATAEPTDVPAAPVVTQLAERPEPPGVIPFTDDPSIVDGPVRAIESWSRLPDDRTIAVHFTSGTSDCYGVHAEVQETADLVAVKLRAAPLPGTGPRVCPMILVPATMTVSLQAPLDDRAVVSIT